MWSIHIFECAALLLHRPNLKHLIPLWVCSFPVWELWHDVKLQLYFFTSTFIWGEKVSAQMLEMNAAWFISLLICCWVASCYRVHWQMRRVGQSTWKTHLHSSRLPPINLPPPSVASGSLRPPLVQLPAFPKPRPCFQLPDAQNHNLWNTIIPSWLCGLHDFNGHTFYMRRIWTPLIWGFETAIYLEEISWNIS